MKTIGYVLIFFGCYFTANAQLVAGSWNDWVDSNDTIWFGSEEAAEMAETRTEN